MFQTRHFTAYASLAIVGLQFQRLKIWKIVAQQVTIKQKKRTHTPAEKLLDCFVNILVGGHGLVEINTRLRADVGLQRAFGRTTCAEQSTISDTLNACTEENVQQLRTVLMRLMRKYSQAYRHDYTTQWQLLDVDLTGLCAGRLGEGVTKGYFPHRKNARGRQLGRVIASHYDEIIAERLFIGKRQLETSLWELVDAATQTLKLSVKQRKNTLFRIDGGGGSETNINALLRGHFQILLKIHNWQRARKLAKTVKAWFPDPKVPGREIGWVTPPHAYAAATDQIAVRKRTPKKKWTYSVIVSTATDAVLCDLNGRTPSPALTQRDRAFLIVYGYDLRGGGAETQNKGDKQGLGLAKRNKHKFVAQEILVLLGQLGHNWVIWTRNALAQTRPSFAQYGIYRMVRDVFRIPGYVSVDADGQVQIILSDAHPLAQDVLDGLRNWLPSDELSLNLGKI